MSKFMKKIKAVSLFSNVGIAETYLEDVGVSVDSNPSVSGNVMCRT